MSGKGCLIPLVMLLVIVGLCGISSGFLAAIVGNGGLLSSIGLDPILPSIMLPAEMVWPMGQVGSFKVGLTNTLIATVLADIVLVVVAARATRKIRAGLPEARVWSDAEGAAFSFTGGERGRTMVWSAMRVSDPDSKVVGRLCGLYGSFTSSRM